MAQDVDGIFEWKRRMGVHWAYHTSSTNRLIHFLCIPFQLFGLIKLLSLLPSVAEWDWALLFIIATAPLYLLPHLPAGVCMVAMLLGLRWLGLQLPGSWIGLLIGAFTLVVPFMIQTQIGHKLFEPGQRDDTEKNIKEFLATKNPIPLALIFYYHMVELWLLLGVQPALKQEIEGHMQRELAEFK